MTSLGRYGTSCSSFEYKNQNNTIPPSGDEEEGGGESPDPTL